MDSGNGHLAAMYGINVVSIWGVTHPYFGFYPFNQDLESALLADRRKYPKIPTSVYGNKYPKGYEKAIETISPKDIITKVDSILQKSPTLM
jgi:ADP-heptose:LPS heptosyltransferase